LVPRRPDRLVAELRLRRSEAEQRGREMAVLEGRERLAREPHDPVTQSLNAASPHAEAAARALADGEAEPATSNLADIRETVREALAEMRLILCELGPPHPPGLRDRGLGGVPPRLLREAGTDLPGPLTAGPGRGSGGRSAVREGGGSLFAGSPMRPSCAGYSSYPAASGGVPVRVVEPAQHGNRDDASPRRHAVVHRLLRSDVVDARDVLREDPLELPLVHDQDALHALAPDAADEALADRVGARRPDRGLWASRRAGEDDQMLT
jgi:hypothetical protein